MLKQSPNRAQRSKGFKVKHVIQACLLLVVCIWLLNQLKHSCDKKAEQQHGTEHTSGKEETELELLKLGRKDIRPRLEDIEGQRDKQEVEEELDEIKAEEMEDEGRGGGDDEIDGRDQERADEESEEVDDLIDVDDREREEVNEQQESDEKDKLLKEGSSEGSRAGNEGDNVVRMGKSKGDDASSSIGLGIRTVTSKLESGSMRKMKAKEIEGLEYELLQRQANRNDADGAIDSDPNSTDEADPTRQLAAGDAERTWL